MSSHSDGNESEPQTAMLLTQAEWDDLEALCSHFCDSTRWAANPKEREAEASHGEYAALHVEAVVRQRALAARIIEANS